MPEEEGEYHTTDPEIQASTSEVRKRFYKTIQEIKYQGHSLDSIEAFLVNNQDMDKLHLLFKGSSNIHGGPTDGQMRMYGVKIIESPYVPEGTIFKVFKNENQFPNLNIPISGSIDVSSMGGHNQSGVIPSWGWSKDQIEDSMFPMTTAIDTGEVTTKEIKDNMQKALEAVDKVMKEPVSLDQVQPKEERHSTKRRIELEE